MSGTKRPPLTSLAKSYCMPQSLAWAGFVRADHQDVPGGKVEGAPAIWSLRYMQDSSFSLGVEDGSGVSQLSVVVVYICT